MTEIGSATTKGLLEFLDQLVEKGRVASGSVIPLKSAVKQIFSAVEGNENWYNIDTRTINVDDYIERFSNKTLGKYSKESLVTYKSRLSKALTWYRNFLLEPGWSPKNSTKTQLKTSKPSTDSHSIEEKNVSEVNQPNSKVYKETESNDLITYPFPLRPGKIVRLYLPLDIKKTEAKRLSNFIESLSIDTDIVENKEG